MKCYFCKVIKGKFPVYKIYEDENTLAFLLDNSQFEGHTIVTTKVHYDNILTIGEHALSNLLNAIKKISSHYINNCGYMGVDILNTTVNDPKDKTTHLHFAIVPKKNSSSNELFTNILSANYSAADMQKKLALNYVSSIY